MKLASQFASQQFSQRLTHNPPSPREAEASSASKRLNNLKKGHLRHSSSRLSRELSNEKHRMPGIIQKLIAENKEIIEKSERAEQDKEDFKAKFYREVDRKNSEI